MSGELALSVEAVAGHARCVEQLAARAGAGVASGLDSSVPSSAFGLMCAPLAAAVVPVQTAALTAASAAVAGLGATAAGARSVADLVGDVDGTVAAHLHALGEELPR